MIYSMEISGMVTIFQTEHFTVQATSKEEAEAKCRELFQQRMWEKHGYADWQAGDEQIIHYHNDWEAQ